MGHKVNPIGFRLGVVKGWQSRWYAERDYKDIFAEDVLIRQTINKELSSAQGAKVDAAISRIEIERAAANQVLVKIHTAKPGIVIGRSGEKVERLRAVLEGKTKKRVRMDIIEIRQPELDAYLVSRAIADQLEKRVSFRRAMKQAVQKAVRANAKGIKVIVGGRLGGAEIARSEKEVEGKVPLQTLRADIDYGQAEAHTTYGVLGIKVWIYKGEILPSKRREAVEGQVEPFAQPAQTGRNNDRRPQDRDRRRREDGGPRGDRGPRPQGDRPRGQDRGPRPQGGGRGPQGGGDQRGGDQRGPRPPRSGGDRRGPGQQQQRPGVRPQGDRPQGDRPPRQSSEEQQRQPAPENQVTPPPTPPTPPAPSTEASE